jgi:hypothetical protein
MSKNFKVFKFIMAIFILGTTTAGISAPCNDEYASEIASKKIMNVFTARSKVKVLNLIFEAADDCDWPVEASMTRQIRKQMNLESWQSLDKNRSYEDPLACVVAQTVSEANKSGLFCGGKNLWSWSQVRKWLVTDALPEKFRADPLLEFTVRTGVFKD